MAHNQENLAVTLDEELLLALRHKATETNRSVSDLIREAIESGLAGDADRAFLKENPGAVEEAAGTGDPGYLAFISYSHADDVQAVIALYELTVLAEWVGGRTESRIFWKTGRVTIWFFKIPKRSCAGPSHCGVKTA